MADQPKLTRAGGEQRAAELIGDGRLVRLIVGEIRPTAALCPKCSKRFAPLSAEGPSSCPTCTCPLIQTQSKGCILHEGTDDYLSGFNTAMESHIRATINPAFRWSDVKDAR